MKVLIILTCALAGVSCGWVPIMSGYQHQHQHTHHVPVIKNGVPVETPEVQHAKAAHFAAISKVVSNPHYNHNNNHQENEYQIQENPSHNNHHEHNNHYDHGNHYDHHGNHYDHHGNQYDHHNHNHEAQPATYKQVPFAYETSHAVPEIGHDGKPLDTPEVEAAKAHHFEAFSKALAMTAPHSEEPAHYHQEHRYRRSVYSHIPVIGHNGVPVEPLEVQEARQKHLEAHASAHHSTSSGYTIHQDHPQVYGHHDSYEIPHIGHDGQPLDTAEVAHAKEAHFAAHHEALARNAVKHVEHGDYWNSHKDYHY